MKRIFLASLAVLLFACSNGPRYQTTVGTDGTTTRIDTRTGKTDILVKMAGRLQWKPVNEQLPDNAVPAKKADCSTFAANDPYRDIFGC